MIEIQSEEIFLAHLPMPPIVNHRLMPHKGRLIKSPDHRRYDKDVAIWKLRNIQIVQSKLHLIQNWIAVGYNLKIILDFQWPKSKLISKHGIPKKLDLDGRLKSAIDAVSYILNVDDKFFIEIHAFKRPSKLLRESVSVSILPSYWVDENDSIPQKVQNEEGH